jgi:Rieske Fe-S protein
LANVADVPVKGGVIIEKDGPEYPVVVTHPSGPTVCAFTAICTHMGCTVSEVTRNVITCFCHGSQYDAATGEVVTPPAPDPLARKSIVVQDGKIYLT